MGAVALRASQVEKMIHAIGYDRKRVKRGKYDAWRNRYMTGGIDNDWEGLERVGFATSRNAGQEMHPAARWYFVTRAGLDFLEGVIGAKITEED